jgi:hypothetical protein
MERESDIENYKIINPYVYDIYNIDDIYDIIDKSGLHISKILKSIRIYNLSGDLIFEGTKCELIDFIKKLYTESTSVSNFVHNLTNYNLFELLYEDWDITFSENDSLQLITTTDID